MKVGVACERFWSCQKKVKSGSSVGNAQELVRGVSANPSGL